MQALKYLAGYPAHVVERAQQLIDNQQLAAMLRKKYPAGHDVKSDRALYFYVMDLKNQFLRQSSPLSKVVYDDKLDVSYQALGLNSSVSRLHGGKLRVKNEIRIGSVFKNAPLDFLKMIAVHELAHLRVKPHNKAFYQLCLHMEPNYHQLEFDARLFLSLVDSGTLIY